MVELEDNNEKFWLIDKYSVQFVHFVNRVHRSLKNN